MPPKPQMQIPVRGVLYKDAHAAAAALGVSLSRVYEAASRDTLDNLGIGRGNHKRHVLTRCKPFVFGPLRFSSHRQAAEALGVTRKTIAKASYDTRAHARVMLAALKYTTKQGARHANDPDTSGRSSEDY